MLSHTLSLSLSQIPSFKLLSLAGNQEIKETYDRGRLWRLNRKTIRLNCDTGARLISSLVLTLDSSFLGDRHDRLNTPIKRVLVLGREVRRLCLWRGGSTEWMGRNQRGNRSKNTWMVILPNQTTKFLREDFRHMILPSSRKMRPILPVVAPSDFSFSIGAI